MKYKRENKFNWQVQVQEDPKTKELFIEFPPGCLEEVGWKEGDTVQWKDNEDGTWSLTKK